MGVIMAAPELLSGALPRLVPAEVKVTVPAGIAVPTARATVAEIVSGVSATPGVGVAETAVTVDA